MSTPLIICVPHAQTSVSAEIMQRVALTEYEVWQFSDPFTAETSVHPEAFAHVLGGANRLECDVSHGPEPVKPFREKDFYGRTIFKPGQEFTSEERAAILAQHAKDYRDQIAQSVEKLVAEGQKDILVVDHHNTAGDHPVHHNKAYMPVVTFCNGGLQDTGEQTDDEVFSASAQHLMTMKRVFEEQTSIPAEINTIYRQSHTLRWVMNDIAPLYEGVRIHGIFIEYNLSMIHNPISKQNDLHALEKLRTAFNAGIDQVLASFSE